MIRIDYHLHTAASPDARSSPAEVVDRALAAGLGMICVADHDTIDGAVALAAAAPRELRVVVGCEFTCDDGSHVIGMGLREPIPERRLHPLLEAIRGQGALAILPHPFRRGSGVFRGELRRSEAFVQAVLARADALEAFNARDTAENNGRSHALAATRGLPAVAGSDAHRPEEIGRTWVEYDGPELVHGVSPRRIFGAPRPPARELALKRRVMELYHARAGRLPALDRAYRALRARLHADGPPLSGAPRLLHAFPAPPPVAAPFSAGEEGPRPDPGDRAPRPPLTAPPARGAGGAAGLAR